ncbi:MAG: NADH-quinone oxidoreductase subunit J [Acidimicrobiia bacterium]|nr:NADH-quinone oxidoreductase subunit J [Acidimicrobiia bacterium]
MDWTVFAVSAVVILTGALGVVTSRNPVHAALSLVLTLFGIAVLFVAQGAHFLAVVQVIVYAGAIVVLFLFVIMLLGVDRAENLEVEPLVGQRPAAVGVGIAALAALLLPILFGKWQWLSGQPSVVGPAHTGTDPNVDRLAKALFTRYLLPFEATSLLLVIAVIGAVVLARRPLATERLGETVREEP